LAGGDEARAAHFDKGMGYITAAWKKDNTISVSAGALSSFFLMKRQFDSVSWDSSISSNATDAV
jgi:hypothetical protein